MKFVASEDIQASASDIWSALTDFDRMEGVARARNVKVTRMGMHPLPKWEVEFGYRDKPRLAEVAVVSLEEPIHLTIYGLGKSLEGDVRVDLQILGPNRTRMTVETEIKARSLSARLFLQSLKLAKSRINKRYQDTASRMVGYIERQVAARKIRA